MQKLIYLFRTFQTSRAFYDYFVKVEGPFSGIGQTNTMVFLSTRLAKDLR